MTARRIGRAELPAVYDSPGNISVRNHPPSVGRMAMSLVRSIGTVAYQAAVNGLPLNVPDAIFNLRIAVCQSCSHFDRLAGKCNLCGCSAKRKMRLSAMKCPLPEPKWRAWDGKSSTI